VTIGDYTLVPNPFWGGAAFPLVVFLILFLWPTLERRVTGDRAFHNLLDRPRDRPWRTAVGAALFTWVALVFLFGAADRFYVFFNLSYTGQLWVYRVLVWALPAAVLVLTHRVCVELRRGEEVALRREAAERAAETA
jgi:ubiquinol-cytochrome c reductase cytochrome b subunit